MAKSDVRESRMIHIRVPPEVHRQLRIQAAEHDVTMQELVERILTREAKKGWKR